MILYYIKPKYIKNVSKQLLLGICRKSGRSKGTISIRHRGSVLKEKNIIKIIDFKYANYSKDAKLALVLSNFIDCNRSSLISLIVYLDGKFKGKYRFILKSHTITKGDLISFDLHFPFKIGSARQLINFPLGALLHSIETKAYKGAALVRSKGTFAVIYGQDEFNTCVKLPSGCFILLKNTCFAILGMLSFLKNKSYTSAGVTRKLEKKPSVRGLAMNPIDHPHGGGVGHTSIGMKSIKTPWGKYGFGVKTSTKLKRKGDKYVII